MKKLTLLLLLPATIQAAPFLSSDATTDTNINYCSVSLNAGPYIDKPLSADRKCNFDLQETTPLATGSHNVNAKFVVSDPIWGRLESTAANFTFSKPNTPALPSGLLLIP